MSCRSFLCETIVARIAPANFVSPMLAPSAICKEAQFDLRDQSSERGGESNKGKNLLPSLIKKA